MKMGINELVNLVNKLDMTVTLMPAYDEGNTYQLWFHYKDACYLHLDMGDVNDVVVKEIHNFLVQKDKKERTALLKRLKEELERS